MTLKGILTIAAAALALHAAPALAQTPGAEPASFTTAVGVPAAVEPAAPVAGPSLERGRVGITVVRAATERATASIPEQDITRRRGVPQMIIGGAAILGGAIVGSDAGTIISVGGLVYGLYGLYLFLQ